MGLRKKKEKTLIWMFLKQVIGLAIVIFLEVSLFVILFSIGLNTGVILPASYAENYLRQNERKIAESWPFDHSLIPGTCTYGLFDEGGNYIEGNLSDSALRDAKAIIQGKEKEGKMNDIIILQEGYCVVHYDISAHFSNPKLHQLFPKPELTIIVLFVVIFVITVITNAIRFGKRLKKQLTPLMEEIEKIKEKELDFNSYGSEVKEFNDILLALNEMRTELSRSLEAEWRTEQRRKENISALAHDIKTPLTVIKGNAELMKEETDITEMYAQADIVNQNADKIERYIGLLIDEAKGKRIGHQEVLVDLSDMIEVIEKQCRTLCETKQVSVVVKKQKVSVKIYVESELLQRAILNLIVNAVEHTEEKKEIRIEFTYIEDIFNVTIEDYGPGFSVEALHHAKEQFFTERIERSNEHYGLGMHFANYVAEKYNGTIEYYNKEHHQGAIVVFKVRFKTV